MEIFKRSAKPIAISAGLTTLTLAGLFNIFKKEVSKPKTTQALEALSEKEKDAMIKNLKVTYNGEMLSADTVHDIAVTLSKFSAAACYNLTQENNQARRAFKHKDNLVKYAELCKESVAEIQSATAQAGGEVHFRLGVSEKLWAKSFGYYLNQGNPKLSNIRAAADQAQLEVIPPKISRELSKEEVINMMTKMTEAYKVEFVNIPFLNAQFRDPNLTSVVISYRATDAVYEQLQIETDDFNSAALKHIPQFGAEEQKIYQEFIEMTQKAQSAPYQAMQAAKK